MAASLGVAAVMLTLTACGGGGGGGSSAAPVTTAPGTPQAVQSVTLAGTAATGAAMAGAQINVRCQALNGSTTAGSDGRFSLTLTGAALPCMLSASSGSTVLYGIAAGTGTGAVTATANVTPLTQLVIAAAGMRDPAAVFSDFPASSLSDADLQKGSLFVTAMLLVSGIDIGQDKPLSDSFRVGDARDAKLDALAARVASGGASLATLVVAARDRAVKQAVSLLSPAPVAACPNLRNTALRLSGSDGSTGFLNPDWAKGTVQFNWGEYIYDGSVALSSTQPCQFTITAKYGFPVPVIDGAASQEGVVVLNDRTRSRIAVAAPDQELTVKDVVGSWNTVEYGPGLTAFGTFTVDAAGKMRYYECSDVGTACSTVAETSTLTASAGVFYLKSDVDGSTTSFYPVRTNSGGIFMPIPIPGAGIVFATQQAAVSLPAVGRVAKYWTAETQGAGRSSFSYGGNTIVVTDTGTGSVTRKDTIDGGLSYRLYNQPRAGIRYRPVQSSGGRNYNALLSLSPGGGLAVYAGAAGSVFFGISVDDK